jgi:hypothetical protein
LSCASDDEHHFLNKNEIVFDSCRIVRFVVMAIELVVAIDCDWCVAPRRVHLLRSSDLVVKPEEPLGVGKLRYALFVHVAASFACLDGDCVHLDCVHLDCVHLDTHKVFVPMAPCHGEHSISNIDHRTTLLSFLYLSFFLLFVKNTNFKNT